MSRVAHTNEQMNTGIYPASGLSREIKTPTAASSLLCIFSSLYMRSVQRLLELYVRAELRQAS